MIIFIIYLDICYLFFENYHQYINISYCILIFFFFVKIMIIMMIMIIIKTLILIVILLIIKRIYIYFKTGKDFSSNTDFSYD